MDQVTTSSTASARRRCRSRARRRLRPLPRRRARLHALGLVRGHAGTIDVGANPQGALKKTIDTALGQAKKGSIDDVISTLENLTVQPFAKAEIADVGQLEDHRRLHGRRQQEGLRHAEGRHQGRHGWVEVGARHLGQGRQRDRHDPARQAQGGTTKKCPERELIVSHEYDCFKEVATEDPVPGIRRRKCIEHKLYLYFDYAKDTLRSTPRAAPRS